MNAPTPERSPWCPCGFVECPGCGWPSRVEEPAGEPDAPAVSVPASSRQTAVASGRNSTPDMSWGGGEGNEPHDGATASSSSSERVAQSANADVRAISDAMGVTSEIARLSHDGRTLALYNSSGETGPRLMLVQEDDPARQSVVLTPYEVRWLAELWRPSDEAAESALEAVVEAAEAWAADSTPETRLRLHVAVAMFTRDSVALPRALPVPVGDETEALRREVDLQMGAKLEAQSLLRAITDSLCLTFSELGNGWMEAAPKVLARIETIVDEADRGFRERDEALARVAGLEAREKAASAKSAEIRAYVEADVRTIFAADESARAFGRPRGQVLSAALRIVEALELHASGTDADSGEAGS